jgi:hypothetical protein
MSSQQVSMRATRDNHDYKNNHNNNHDNNNDDNTKNYNYAANYDEATSNLRTKAFLRNPRL